MVIREMQAQDVEAVTALEAACFTQPWKRHDFEDILTNPDRFYFVAGIISSISCAHSIMHRPSP